MLIALPIYLQLVWGYNALEAGLTLAPLSLTMFGVALLAGKRAGKRRPASIVRAGFVLLGGIDGDPDPASSRRADSGWRCRDPPGARGSRARAPGVSAQQLRAVADLGGAGRRGRRRDLGDRIVWPLVRSRLRGRDHARDTVDRLHQQGGIEQRPPPGRAAAGRGSAGGRRPGDERRTARGAAGGPARGDPGRDPQHQRRRPPSRTPGRAAPSRSSPSLIGIVQRVPHDAPAGPGADDLAGVPTTAQRGRSHLESIALLKGIASLPRERVDVAL